MSRRLSSPRFRRRLAWSSVLLALGGAAVGGAMLVGNTGRRSTSPLSDRPAWVYREPHAHHVTREELRDLEQTTSLFIRTAVTRRDLDRAWGLASPVLRAGMSRAEWTSGDNTVVPFPAQRITAWNVDYAYENDVAFDVSLLSKPPYDTIGKTFMIELTRRAHSRMWLVEYWAPKGVSSPEVSRAFQKTPPPAIDETHAPLSARWLLAPAAIVGSALGLLALAALRSAVRSRRLARRYAAELSSYTSSSSPS